MYIYIYQERDREKYGKRETTEIFTEFILRHIILSIYVYNLSSSWGARYEPHEFWGVRTREGEAIGWV